jgi:N-acyl-D-amino-acid deacylase
MFDVLFSGGWVVDGTGAPPWRADVAVSGSRIVAVGQVGAAESRQHLDVSGQYVFPGFIDAHVHADVLYKQTYVQEAALRQGVTTLVVGQDGVSCAPAPPATAAYASEYFAAVNGTPDAGAAPGFATIRDALEDADRASAVNVAWLVPAGIVRHQVLGGVGRRSTPEELRAMQAVVANGMQDGAVGLSTGLDYLPGRYGDAAEIAALCEPVVEAGGVYVSHMRGYDVEAWRGMAELCEIARQAGAAAHVSHYFGPATMLERLINNARASGIDVTFDSYPYLRGATILAMAALPPEVQLGGTQQTLARLADRNVRRDLLESWFPSIEQRLREDTLAFVAADNLSWAEGMSLADAAAEAGSEVGEFVCDLLLQSKLAVGCVRGQKPTNGEEDIRILLKHEAHMGGSDGIFVGSAPHPRGWGTFARFLGRHVRDLGDWTWGEAALHLAGHPARRFGLDGRGVIRRGAIADLAVVDPYAVTDLATFAEPRRLAIGVSHVLVGGAFVLRDGAVTGAQPGSGIRRGAT